MVEDIERKLLLTAYIKSYTGFWLPSKCMTLNDPWARFKDVCVPIQSVSIYWIFFVFSVCNCKRSWNGLVGTSLVDLLSAGLSQSLIRKPVGLSESGSSITWWHRGDLRIRDLLLIYSFALKSHFSSLQSYCVYGTPKLSWCHLKHHTSLARFPATARLSCTTLVLIFIWETGPQALPTLL